MTLIDTEMLDQFNKIVNADNPAGRIELVEKFFKGWFVALHIPKPMVEQLLAKFEQSDLPFLKRGKGLESTGGLLKKLGVPNEIFKEVDKHAVQNCEHRIKILKVFLDVRGFLIDSAQQHKLYPEAEIAELTKE